MTKRTAGRELRAPSGGVSTGQRRLIFATTARIGLRDEQLHDLVESASDYRTRAVSALSISEARRLIGILKKLERGVVSQFESGR